MHFVMRWRNEVRGKDGIGDPDATRLLLILLAEAEADATAKPRPNLTRRPVDFTRFARGELDKKTGEPKPGPPPRFVSQKGMSRTLLMPPPTPSAAP